MDRQLFYKVFSEIVNYPTPYHAVEEAIVAANFRDAAFVFQLPFAKYLGMLTCSPFAVDAAIHVAAFLLNADIRKFKNAIHIANHIGSPCVLGDLSSHGPWWAYATVREQDAKAGTSLCNVYGHLLQGAQPRLLRVAIGIGSCAAQKPHGVDGGQLISIP